MSYPPIQYFSIFLVFSGVFWYIQYNLFHAQNQSFYLHGVVFDELHTQPNRKLFDVMTQGSGDAPMQPLFCMVGGFRFEELGFAKKMLLKALKKVVAKKENRSRQEDFMAQALGTSFDHATQEQIHPLVACLQAGV